MRMQLEREKDRPTETDSERDSDVLNEKWRCSLHGQTVTHGNNHNLHFTSSILCVGTALCGQDDS